jgi:hypothetical protein
VFLNIVIRIVACNAVPREAARCRGRLAGFDKILFFRYIIDAVALGDISSATRGGILWIEWRFRRNS